MREQIRACVIRGKTPEKYLAQGVARCPASERPIETSELKSMTNNCLKIINVI